MMRTIIIASLAAECFGTPTWGQEPAGAAPVKPMGAVTIGIVQARYQKYRAFKIELESVSKTLDDRRDLLECLVTQWRTALNNGHPDFFDEQEREEAVRNMLGCQRQLCDLSFEAKTTIATRLEEQTTQLNSEIDDCSREYGVAHGYHLIFARTEPVDPKLLRCFVPDTNPVETPVVVDDITLAIVEILNARYALSQNPISPGFFWP